MGTIDPYPPTTAREPPRDRDAGGAGRRAGRNRCAAYADGSAAPRAAVRAARGGFGPRLLDDPLLRRVGGEPGRAPERLTGGPGGPGPGCHRARPPRRPWSPGGFGSLAHPGRLGPALPRHRFARPGRADHQPRRRLRHHRHTGRFHLDSARRLRPGRGHERLDRQADSTHTDQSPLRLHRGRARHRSGRTRPAYRVRRVRSSTFQGSSDLRAHAEHRRGHEGSAHRGEHDLQPVAARQHARAAARSTSRCSPSCAAFSEPFSYTPPSTAHLAMA